MMVAVVHVNLRTYKGAYDPPSVRISLPSTMKLLDRNTVYDFVGMPTEELDGGVGVLERFDIACTADAIRAFEMEDDLSTGSNVWDRVTGHMPGESSHCPDGKKTCTKKEFV